MLAVVKADFVDGDDVGVVEVGGCFGFDLEAFDLGLVRQMRAANHLEGDNAIGRQFAGAVDNAHAAARQFGQEFVAAEAAGKDAGLTGPALRQVIGN